jgi:hypothetical protein
MMAAHVWYASLNGSRKQEDISKSNWTRIPGSGGEHPIHVKRHCGGILALRITPSGAVEITEETLRERLRQAGMRLPWEVDF